MKKYEKIQERLLDSSNLEVRALEEDGKKVIEGYALTYNTRSKLLYDSFYEIIEPGAFDDVLRSDDLDVIYNFNHNNSVVMGRTKNGTLSLRSDQKGLFFRAVLPDTSDARDMHTLISEGYISENSFAFMPAKNGYRQETLGDGKELITITKVDRLRDVSSVVFPAYPETSVSARADEESKEKSREEKLKEIAKQLNDLIEAEELPDEVEEEIEEKEEVVETVDESVEEVEPDQDKPKKKFLKI